MNSLKFMPGIGPINADIMIIGEAPGEEEEKQGKPFVGRAGSLLNKWLQEYYLRLSNIYITNVIKVKIQNNKKPTFEEIQSWRPLLIEEIKRQNPQLIITLGLSAAKALHNFDDINMKTIRGSFHKLPDLPIDHINTYHPSYIIRQPYLQEEVFKDFDAVLDYLSDYSLLD